MKPHMFLTFVTAVTFAATGCLKKNTGSSDKSAEIVVDRKTNTATLKVAIKDALKKNVQITKVVVSGTPKDLPELAGFEFYTSGKFPPAPDCTPSNPCVADNNVNGKGSTTDPGSKGITTDPGSKGSTTDPGSKGNSVATNDVGGKGSITNDPCCKGGSIQLNAGETMFAISNIPLSSLPESVQKKLLNNVTALDGTDPNEPFDLNTEIIDAKSTSLADSTELQLDESKGKDVIPSKGQLAPAKK